ncbi:MAG: 30S ribosomal protein S6 [Candidatus Pacebacteria bacterium]|nr:30S ribosomal protein S6 [Candidatus Paceibacterota bacterium]
MKQYELTFLIPASYTKSEMEEILAGVEELVEKNDGKVAQKEEWGKKELAYTIKKEGKAFDEAEYYHWLLELDPASVKPLNQALNLNEIIIRYLIVALEE